MEGPLTPLLVRCDMLANVWRLHVAPGDVVEPGDLLVMLESMKMEIPVTSPRAGTVARVLVVEGESVDEGDALLELS